MSLKAACNRTLKPFVKHLSNALENVQYAVINYKAARVEQNKEQDNHFLVYVCCWFMPLSLGYLLVFKVLLNCPCDEGGRFHRPWRLL